MLKRAYFFTFLSLICASGCNHTKKKSKAQTSTAAIQHVLNRADQPIDGIQLGRPTITIWIHGTRRVSMTVFPRFFRSIQGMHHASAYNKRNNLLRIAQTLSESDSEQFPFDDIFCFGWSGKLSYRERLKAAQDLHGDILKLVEAYEQKYGVKPKIRLITHSHGGNVAFYLPKVQQDKASKIEIDELVLLACPVQKRTMHFAKDDMFKNLYALYSTRDMIQVLDPQGIFEFKNFRTSTKDRTPIFSERVFPEQENLKQKKIKINGRSITHLDFVLKKFVRNLPQLLTGLRGEELEEIAQLATT